MPSPAYETVTRPIPWLELVDGAESDGHYSSAVRETRHIARAALSAMPHAALLREALEALDAFAEKAHNWDAEPYDLEIELNAFGRGIQPCLHVDEFRRARAAADKIRAALTQEKQT